MKAIVYLMRGFLRLVVYLFFFVVFGAWGYGAFVFEAYTLFIVSTIAVATLIICLCHDIIRLFVKDHDWSFEKTVGTGLLKFLGVLVLASILAGALDEVVFGKKLGDSSVLFPKKTRG